MTEAEWLACADTSPMLAHVRGSASGRKLRLFAAGCLRRVWHTLSDERSRHAVEQVEAYADGLITQDALSAAQVGADRGTWKWTQRRGTRHTSEEWKQAAGAMAVKFAARPTNIGVKLATAVANAAHQSLFAEAPDRMDKTAGLLYQCALLRDIFGIPFRPVTFSPEWRTDTAVILASQMYDTRDFSAMPILADALQDAGCEDQFVLDHCRGSGPHVRGCWVAALVLRKA